MRPAAERHLEEATAFIAVAESGDAKQAAYRRAAEEIEAAIREDSTLTHRDVAGQIGKSHTYVRRLLTALERARSGDEFRIDWGRKDREQVGAEKVAREQPDAFVGAYRQAPPKVQREIARQIAAEPFIGQEVSRRDAAERKRQVEEANRQRDATAAPLPAYMSKMVVKINEWAAGLASIEPDLESLPDGRGRELVLDALRELSRQTHRCMARVAPADDVIDGKVA